jgi:hypothetical protein
MPKLQGPLFSLGASGSIGKTLVFRKTRHGLTVQRWSKPTDPATDAQLPYRAYWSAARDAWRALEAADRATWQQCATSWSLPPFTLFAREYILQRITAPNLPLIPADKSTLP